MNQTIITGFLGRDPEMRYTPEGKAITNFSVAVSDGFGEHKKTLWFRCNAWEKKAEVCNQYLKKGSRVLVKGRLIGDPKTGGPKLWTKQDGTAGASFELTVEDVEFLSSQAEQQQSGVNAPQAAEQPNEDDIPF
jgi:single-strand DNA-binding protein